MSAAADYTNEVHGQLRRYATWLPSEKMTVGTVGQLQGNLFVPISDLNKFNIPIRVVDDPNTEATYKFNSTDAREVAVGASASNVPTSAGLGAAKLNISFSKKHSVYLALYGCSGSAVDDLIGLGNKILDRVKKREWALDYAVVTRVVTAKSATILQALSKGASIELEGGTAGVPVADLLKAGGSVKVNSTNSIGFSVVAEKKLTPLFSLARVSYNFVDWVLGSDPKMSYSGSRVALKPFTAHVDATSNIGFKRGVQGKNDIQLKVKLRKHGEYVDIGDLVDLTARTSEMRPLRSSRTRIMEPENFGLDTQIHGKRLFEIVDQLPDVELDTAASSDQFINLNVTLPKTGTNVSTAPLVKLALTAAAPRARASTSAELTFGEIP